MQKTPRKYSVEEREEAVRLAGQIGLTAAASKMGIPVPTVSHWLRRLRLAAGNAEERRREKPRRYTGEERAEGIRLAAEVGVTAAASQLGVPPTTLREWLGKERQGTEAASPEGPRSESSDREDAVSEATVEPSKPERRVAKVYTPSQRAQALELAARETVSAAAIKYGVSRFSIYEWQRKTRLHAEGKAADSPVVGSDEDRVAARDHRILSEWKAHPGLGPSQVRNQLRRQGFKVSVHTVRCVLEEHGYVTPKSRRQSVHDQRYEAVRPNHIWHLDFLHRYINKQKIYVLLIVDDFSRFIVGGAMWDGERAAAVQETFLAAVARHGRPEKAMSDGGSAFYSWKGVSAFTRLLDELEVDQFIAEIPEVNGKLEVLNANIQKELFDKEHFFDLGEAQRRLLSWIQFYNLRRTHHALGGLLVPGDRYFGRADEVLASIEAGRNAEGIGEPVAPGDRQLDLFRVTSHRGRVEVHLLGHRILIRESP